MTDALEWLCAIALLLVCAAVISLAWVAVLDLLFNKAAGTRKWFAVCTAAMTGPHAVDLEKGS